MGNEDLFSFKSFLKKGITEPLEFRTLPYLTIENLVLYFFPPKVFADTKSLSEASLVAPYKFTGAQRNNFDIHSNLVSRAIITSSCLFNCHLKF